VKTVQQATNVTVLLSPLQFALLLIKQTPVMVNVFQFKLVDQKFLTLLLAYLLLVMLVNIVYGLHGKRVQSARIALLVSTAMAQIQTSTLFLALKELIILMLSNRLHVLQ